MGKGRGAPIRDRCAAAAQPPPRSRPSTSAPHHCRRAVQALPPLAIIIATTAPPRPVLPSPLPPPLFLLPSPSPFSGLAKFLERWSLEVSFPDKFGDDKVCLPRPRVGRGQANNNKNNPRQLTPPIHRSTTARRVHGCFRFASGKAARSLRERRVDGVDTRSAVIPWYWRPEQVYK